MSIAIMAFTSCTTSTIDDSTGGQTGDENWPEKAPGTGSVSNNGFCEYETTVLRSENEVSPLGFSASDVLAFAEGQHSHRLVWQLRIPRSEIELDFGPEKGEQDVRLNVEYDAGEIRFIKAKSPDDVCGDSLEIDVRVTIKTGGGALDETFDTTLQAWDASSAMFTTELDIEKLKGSFEITKLTPSEYRPSPIWIRVQLSQWGISGLLSVSLETDHSSSSAISARWPADTDCDVYQKGHSIVAVTNEGGIGEVSATTIIEPINTASMTVVWEDGVSDEFDLRLTPEPTSVCLTVSPFLSEYRELLFTVEASATTDDDRLDASFTATVSAQLDNALDIVRIVVSFTPPPLYGLTGNITGMFPNELGTYEGRFSNSSSRVTLETTSDGFDVSGKFAITVNFECLSMVDEDPDDLRACQQQRRNINAALCDEPYCAAPFPAEIPSVLIPREEEPEQPAGPMPIESCEDGLDSIDFGQPCGTETDCIEDACYVPGTEQNSICSKLCNNDSDCPCGTLCLAVGGQGGNCFLACTHDDHCTRVNSDERNPLYCAPRDQIYEGETYHDGHWDEEPLQGSICIQESEP